MKPHPLTPPTAAQQAMREHSRNGLDPAAGCAPAWGDSRDTQCARNGGGFISAGLGLKPEHFDAALAARAPGLWFEVHPENYMVDGGPRLAWLEAVRARHPLSLHGVSMSLAGEAAPDGAHLRRLAALVRRFDPVRVSEHLAWSRFGEHCLPDLLPAPRSTALLQRLVDRIDAVQTTLGRQLAIENPTHYLHLPHSWDEPDFLHELARRSGCGLLLDINNVHVSARNLGFDAADYIDRFPADAVTEIHLAGHTADPVHGEALLVDSHDTPVAEAVWALHARFVARAGPRPTLIERDGNLPSFDALMAERARAAAVLAAAHSTASASPPPHHPKMLAPPRVAMEASA